MQLSRIQYLVQVAAALLLSTAALADPSQPTPGGWEVGTGGGDTVHCAAAPGARFEGNYALDYVATSFDSPDDSDLEPSGASWEQEASAQYARILPLYPKLAESFRSFSEQIGNTDQSRKYVWRKAPFGLVDIEDDHLLAALPPNCQEEPSAPGKKPRIRQAIVRDARPGIIFFYRDPLVDELRSNVRQYSFLMVHEWLRNFVSDAKVIRDVNRLLHSKEASTLSPATFRLLLARLGVSLERIEKEDSPASDSSASSPKLRAKNLALGMQHSCAVTTEGVQCWGYAGLLQTEVPRALKNLPHPEKTVISASGDRTCAIADGKLRCWGDEAGGMGHVPANVQNPHLVAAGYYHVCAALEQSVVCWGLNSTQAFGALDAPKMTHTRLLALGRFHSCGVADEGLKCWGPQGSEVTHIPRGLKEVTDLAAGEAHTCALSQGKVKCWGDDSEGQLRVPSDLPPVIAIAAGGQQTCAVTEELELRCWGSNRFRQSNPPEDLGKVLSVAVGGMHACAWTEEQGLVCWGDPSYGQCQPPGDLGALPTQP